jgi:hypothetical protein
LRKFAIICGFVFLVLMVGGGILFHRDSGTVPNFWPAFLPNLWASLIGVSLAAIIGIPIGFLINRYFVELSEKSELQNHRREVLVLLEHLRVEVSAHSGIVQLLAQTFYRSAIKVSLTTSTIINPERLAGLMLQDVFGRQFLSSRGTIEIGESLIMFEVGNYYARVWELNRTINLRIQDIKQPEAWDSAIENLVQIVSGQQSQIDLALQRAIERLGQ